MCRQGQHDTHIGAVGGLEHHGAVDGEHLRLLVGRKVLGNVELVAREARAILPTKEGVTWSALRPLKALKEGVTWSALRPLKGPNQDTRQRHEWRLPKRHWQE